MRLFETILGILRTYLFSHATNRIDVELGARLFQHLLALPTAYFQTRRVGDSVARVRELESIRTFLTSSALTLVIDLFFTFVFLGVMFLYSPLLTVDRPCRISVLRRDFRRGDAAVSPAARREVQARRGEPGISGGKRHRRRDPQGDGGRAANAATLGRAACRLCGGELPGPAARQYRQQQRAIRQQGRSWRAFCISEPGWSSPASLTVGELVAFNMLAGRVSQPVLRLAQIWQDFHQARLSVERLGDILNTAPEPRFNPARAALPAIRGDVTFDHVVFRYRIDGPEVLHDVSFSVSAGQVIGIVGPSGSGKSTVAKLIQRLYIPERGRVLVDGVDLAMVDTSWLRRQIGAVLQENVLFNQSIRDNIALPDPAMPIERVVEAAKLAGAHDFILELPEGYDTVVGERGASLSGGQRQRIAIARALVTNPRILIFDEATSALDYESERIIQDNMQRIAQGRTVFIIAHRLSTVRRSDRIITIDRGRLVEDGTHEELINKGGRYATLHRVQAGDVHGVR